MKKLYFFFLFLGLLGCNQNPNTSSNTKEETKENDLEVIGKAPKFSFTNQNNQVISNESYKGMVYVVDFFFTTCPTICPIMTEKLVKIQNAFKDKRIGFASFSINPEHDTPEVLKDYAIEKGVTNPNWNFLTGDVDAIYDLANNGFNLYAKTASEEVGGFEHSGYFALIDQEGNIVSRKNEKGKPMVYYDGLNENSVEKLIEDIEKIIEE